MNENGIDIKVRSSNKSICCEKRPLCSNCPKKMINDIKDFAKKNDWLNDDLYKEIKKELED